MIKAKIPSDYPHLEPSFILKKRRIEYVMEFFRGQIDPKSIRELADGNFVDELRFHMARIVGISYVCGLNAALFSYWLLFRKLKVYLGVPLTLCVFYQTRNLIVRNSLDKIYYPI